MDIGGRSIRWLLAAAMIAVGALLDGLAVWLVWRPCAGSMLNGSILVGYTYPTEFTDACLQAMNGHPIFPMLGTTDLTSTGILGTIAAILLATAWLVLLPALRLPGWTRLIAGLPSLLVLLGVATAAHSTLNVTTSGWPGSRPLLLANLAVPVALIALARAGIRGAALGRAAIVVVAAATPGALSQAFEYLLAIMLSDAFWDTPPGTGYLRVAFCLAAGIATAFFWWRDRARGASASYAGGHQAARDPEPVPH